MKTGDSAFPIVHPNPRGYDVRSLGDEAYIVSQGMDLRDWFAGQALQGVIALGTSADVGRWARRAYEWADAMMEARKR